MGRKLSTEEITLILASAGICAVAAPYVVTGLVNLLGFETGGIKRRSAGASFMASYGGFVPSESLVSNLQSTGASGLGTSALLKSMVVGAIIGGGTASVAIANGWHRGIEPSASKLTQSTGELYEKWIEPSASKLAQSTSELYEKWIEPSASKLAQGAGELYKKGVEPSASKLAQDAGELYKKGIEPSASKLAQGAGKLYEKGIVPLTSGFVRTIGGWFS